MDTKESYRDRQENELEVLKSIFNDDVIDLRPKQEKWIPLDIKIKLTPAQDSKASQAFCAITLHLICTKTYPRAIPKIQLENAKGLTDNEVSKLHSLLNSEAFKLKGEVMVFELCQFVQNYLHEHNTPKEVPVVEPTVYESFYDKMLKDREIQGQRKLKDSDELERKQQERLKNDIQRRREQLMKENRTRRNTISESSPRHRSTSNSEDSRNTNEACDEHRCSQTIYIPSTGRKIQTSACLGHSQKGCVNYSGVDLATGKLLFITEWILVDSQLEAKELNVESVIETIERKVAELSKLRHKHLIGYDGVLCVKKKDYLQIFLFQEFLLGISIFSISGWLGWCPEGASMIAKGVLEALIFLHNNGVTHGNILDSTVFMDNSGNIRVTDFYFIPYLQELISGEKSSNDLCSLGTLVESLMPTPHAEMRDFINRCKSDRTLSASDLLDHPFLYYAILAHQKTPPCEDSKPLPKLPEAAQQAIYPAAAFLPPLVSSDVSRIQEDFVIDSFIGKGAYGDVLKVRNKLDNRQYAIKRIPLSSKNKLIFKKMTREVELLSRLNHENVVRYFNSWIETQMKPLADEDDYEDSDGSLTQKRSSAMVKTRSQTHLAVAADGESSDDDSFSPGWNNFIGNSGESDSESDDGIEFVNSQGERVVYSDKSLSDEEKRSKANSDEPVSKKHILYIQMEFCEKSTLRTVIDADLYLDKERLWKLFREIVEGLTHIHQQGMIHRDLKPVNIFLDSKDHVKIGDFGLATTSILALQNQHGDAHQAQLNYGDSLTGQVGTALYVAPELAGKASKSTYNQKVDLYSLGIIFFEMCTPPLITGMERIKTISAIRHVDIKLPKEMVSDEKYKTEVKLLKWLLDHVPDNRPTSEELLQSELLPPAKMDVIEMQDMLRRVLSNPQSRNYKHLVSKCLQQESDTVCRTTYDTGMMAFNPIFEHVKSKVVQILRKHGAYDVSTPLLTPYTVSKTPETAVRLMAQSGSVVTLPYELRKPFLRHVVLNGNCFVRRYSIGRIYREKKIHNAHPKQNFECAFDIISPHRGNLYVDAELLTVANEIVNEFDILKQKNITFRINHTSLLRAIFLFHSVPSDKYKGLIRVTRDFLEGKITRLSAREAIMILLPNKEALRDILLVTDCSISHASSTFLKAVLDKRGEAHQLAKGAIRELEHVIKLSQSLGVSITFDLCVGLMPSNSDDCNQPGSVIWQMIAEFKPGKQTVLADGGRFDNTIEEFKNTAKSYIQGFVGREMYCGGFSLAIDKIVLCLSAKNDLNLNWRQVASCTDLMVYISGSHSQYKIVTSILKSIWDAGIKSCFVEVDASKSNEDELWANLSGASQIILIGDEGSLKIKSWLNDHYYEKSVSLAEVLDYIKRNFNVEVAAITENLHQNLSIARNNSLTNVTSRSFEAPINSSKTIDVIFVTNEKLNQNRRKRLENQIEDKLKNVVEKFNRKETFAIFAVELDSKTIKALVTCIDPNPKDQKQTEFDALFDKFAKVKQKYLQEVYDEITDLLAKNKNKSIVGIISIQDLYYRLIL